MPPYRSVLFTAILLLTFFFLYAQVLRPHHNEVLPGNAPMFPLPDSVTEISISLTGDLMCHKPQTTNARQPDGTYNFNPSFTYIKPYLSTADITIGNLETTFGGPELPYAGYPAFNSPDAYAKALKENGFDFLVTANNHSMDTGEEGLLRTIDVIRKNELAYAGTYCSQSDHDSLRILNIKGIKLGILNYTYGTNGAYPRANHSYMLNIIDSVAIINETACLKKAGAEVVLVFFHFGNENAAEPTSAQKDAVRYARQAGAQLIIGAHPHVIGPAEWLEPYNAESDSAFVAYSLGNFISNQYWRYTDAGVILTLRLRKHLKSGKIKLIKAEYLPTWVYRAEKEGMKHHVVLPAALCQEKELLPGFIDSAMVKKMEQAFNDTRNILSKYSQRLVITPVSSQK